MILNILKIILVTATIYHASPDQTDDTPFITASGSYINADCPICHRWIAVSRDLEAKGFVFGARVKVTGAGHLDGIWTVQDRMNRRWENRIDFLVGEDISGGKWEYVEIQLLD